METKGDQPLGILGPKIRYFNVCCIYKDTATVGSRLLHLYMMKTITD